MGTTLEITIQVQKKILRQDLGWLMKRSCFQMIDNIVKTLHRIQAYTEQDEDDEEMEL